MTDLHQVAEDVLSGKTSSHVEAAKILATAYLAAQEDSLAQRVRAFHLRFGHPVNFTPAVPEADQVRARLKKIADEFFWLLAACEIWPTWQNDGHDAVDEVKASQVIENAIEHDFCGIVELPDFVAALANLQHVIEGTAAVFGVDMSPILAEIHRASMSKEPVMIEGKCGACLACDRLGSHLEPDPTQSPVEPDDYTAPDIEGELVKQGWQP